MNHAVIDLQFGDAGKGSITDSLVCRLNSPAVVRFNGGYNAAHHVVLSDGRFHCFSTFGSGTLAGARTHLASPALFNPLAAQAEVEALVAFGISSPLTLLSVSPDCLLVTPLHSHLSRMREVARRYKRKGSCGKGIGEAILDSQQLGSDVLHAADLFDRPALERKLRYLWHLKIDQAKQLIDQVPDNQFLNDTYVWLTHRTYVQELLEAYDTITPQLSFVEDSDFFASVDSDEVIWEGAQGTLLDAKYGFWPYVTKSRTTTQNIYDLLSEHCSLKAIGVLRAYTTRHGRGPFPTESSFLTKVLPDIHNPFNTWQEGFRVGWLDLVLLKYALSANQQIDYLAITNLDRLRGLQSVNVCCEYRLSKEIDMSVARKYGTVERRGGENVLTEISLPKTQEEQETLTGILSGVSPVYREFSHWSEGKYLDFISESLGKPIACVSRGPTADDKVWDESTL